ncbi:MAG: PPC domain-containing protein [Planctomycetaceae bacterium]
MRDNLRRLMAGVLPGLVLFSLGVPVNAQSVCLPVPRLLTMLPMGAQAGTSVDVTIGGDFLEDIEELLFSHPGITAVPKADAAGLPMSGQFVVTIAADCPPGLHEARTISRLGVSSSRVFTVGTLPETLREAANTSLETATAVNVNSVCNAVMTQQNVDFYRFDAKKDQRIIIDCAATGIDSKLKAVLIVADAAGNDLQVQRRGGAIDFTVPEDGGYVVKVHDLTFKGGSPYFYRLAVQEVGADDPILRLPATQSVSSFSWPPADTAALGSEMVAEAEPNNQHSEAQKISLPCSISGRFFPAADVDVFEFTATKGDVWWVEVASERLGRPTDPAIVVQHVIGSGETEQRTDVAELSDIASPIKISSNGYAYDGPPYNAGSSDIIGKLEIKEDGVHRLRLSDLFGGTRTDPDNIYRLIIRRAVPDFAIVGWALHMELRNGDRNALSKPLALRNGGAMPIEVVAVRRDGFDGDIELSLDDLPEGVTATGLKIPAGKSRGIVVVSAAENAPRGFSIARFSGRARINEQDVIRPGQLASMAWPIPDASQEIPAPRLLMDIPVSVCGSEGAPISLAVAEDKVWEVKEGEKLTLPLKSVRRCEFSGPKMSLKTMGEGFESNPAFDAPLDADSSEVTLDLEKLKTKAGEYTIAFYGGAVAKYRHHPEAVTAAEAVLVQAKAAAETSKSEAVALADVAKNVTDEQKAEADRAAQAAVEKQKIAEAAVTAAEKALEAATKAAAAKDIVDIVVSAPVRIRVTPKEGGQ